MTQWVNGNLIISTLAERLAEHISGFQTIFGEDRISLNPDDLDMQQIAIYAEAIHSLDELIQAALLQFNPVTATGDGLSRLVQLNRIRRKPGAYSVGVVQATGTAGTLITKGHMVKNSLTGDIYTTDEDATIGDGGTVLIPVTAQVMGPKTASVGTLTTIGSPEYGWQSVTNLTPVTPGRDVETDEQLRIRQARSQSTPGQSVIDALRGAVANLEGVIHSKIYENKEDTTNADGLPPHSIHTVVLGGTDQDIWDTLRLKSSIGLTYVGTEEGYSVDSTGNPQLIRFSRPTAVPIYIAITLTAKAGWPTDGADRLKDALVAWGTENQDIGQEVIQSQLYDPVNTVPGHSITSMFIGTAADPTTTDDITIAVNAIASFDQARITVNGA